ncbi:MAG: hypothetical protein ACTHMO_12805 [Rhodanobacteraceae bacterium]
MKLVPDWKSAWRWTSVHAMTAAVAINAAWMGLPPDLQTHVTERDAHALTIVVLALGIIGRLRDQAPVQQLPKPTVPDNRPSV